MPLRPHMLVSRNIGVIALAVCNPAYAPQQYADFFAACGISNYDIMIPDATVDESPPSIAAFYKGLFDLWLEANRSTPTTDIRIISDMEIAPDKWAGGVAPLTPSFRGDAQHRTWNLEIPRRARGAPEFSLREPRNDCALTRHAFR